MNAQIAALPQYIFEDVDPLILGILLVFAGGVWVTVILLNHRNKLDKQEILGGGTGESKSRRRNKHRRHKEGRSSRRSRSRRRSHSRDSRKRIRY